MKRIASIHVYDALETVQINCLVRVYDDYEHGESELALERHVSLQSTGEPEDWRWLQDALVGLLESL